MSYGLLMQVGDLFPYIFMFSLAMVHRGV